MASKPPRVSQLEWERHKETIKRLYHDEGLPLQSKIGKRSVISIMRDDHSFLATLAQYHTQLGKWNLLKKGRALHWEPVLYILDHLQSQGIQARVKISGRVIKDESVRRAQRYVRTKPTMPRIPSQEWLSISESGQISIETRTGDGSWSTYSPIIDPGSASDNNQIQNPSFRQDGSDELSDPVWSAMADTNNATLFLEQSTLESLNGIGCPRLQSVPGSSLPEPSLIVTTSNSTLLPVQNPMSEFTWPALSGSMSPDFLGALYASSSEAGFQNGLEPHLSDQVIDAIQKGSAEISSTVFDADPFPYGFHEQPPHNLIASQIRPLLATIPVHICVTASITPQNFINVLWQEAVFHQQDIATFTDGSWLRNIDGVLGRLQSLLPENMDQYGSQGSLDMTQSSNSFEDTFSHILLYSIANGFAGFSGVPIGTVFKSLRKHTQLSHMIFEHLRRSQSHFATSLAENLFRAAVEACDAQAVGTIFQTMKDKGAVVDVNDIVCEFQDRKYTALELAAKLRNFDTIQLLIEMGANPNKTFECDFSPEKGALELALRTGSKEYVPLDKSITRALLDAGSKICLRLLEVISRWNTDSQFQEDIVEQLSLENHSQFIDSLHYLIGRLENNVALKLTMKVVHFCEQLKCFCYMAGIMCSNCSKPSLQRGLRRALVEASRRANLGLCKFLLGYVKPGIGELTAAFWGENLTIINLMIEHGATVSADSVSLERKTEKPSYPQDTTILAEAIRSKNPSLILLAQQLGVWKFMEKSTNYLTVAIIACADVGDVETMEKILKTYPSVDRNILGYALSVGLHRGHGVISSMLLLANACVNLRSEYTPIHEAIKRRDRTIVDMILESDIDINEYNPNTKQSKSVLELAGLWGDISVIKDLLNMGFGTDNGLHTTVLAEAVKSNTMDLVELLLRHGADPNASAKKGNSPLHEAAKKGDGRMIQYLLSRGANPADLGAFVEASKQQKEPLAILLVAFAARYPNGQKKFGAEVLIQAIKANDRKLLKTLLEAKMDIHGFSTNNNCTPLGAAIRNDRGNHFDLIKDILSAGAKVESIAAAPFGLGETDDNESNVWPKQTALLEAIEARNERMVKLVLDNGANVNRPARRGIKRTPLQKACEIGSYGIVQLLISRGANVNDPPALRGGGSALQLASGTGSIKIVLLLLFHNAQVDGPTSAVEGRSALEAAAANGRLNILRILWGSTQGRGFPTQEVNRAVGFAKVNGYQACVNCLEELHSASQRESDVSSALMRSI